MLKCFSKWLSASNLCHQLSWFKSVKWVTLVVGLAANNLWVVNLGTQNLYFDVWNAKNLRGDV